MTQFIATKWKSGTGFKEKVDSLSANICRSVVTVVQNLIRIVKHVPKKTSNSDQSRVKYAAIFYWQFFFH